MLLQIRDYMRQMKKASNQQIAKTLGLDISALQPMLEYWLRKDFLIQVQEKFCASNCVTCVKPIFYEVKVV